MAEEGLAERLAALEERVARLEGPAASASTDPTDVGSPRAPDGLHKQPAEFASAEGESAGAVQFTGMVNLPSGENYVWQQRALTRDLLEAGWSEAHTAFAALGHPVRLELLRHILNGHHTTTELNELPDLGTTGQLYHHLKQLVSAGWLYAPGRGRYDVPATKVIPLLTLLSAVYQNPSGDIAEEAM